MNTEDTPLIHKATCSTSTSDDPLGEWLEREGFTLNPGEQQTAAQPQGATPLVTDTRTHVLTLIALPDTNIVMVPKYDHHCVIGIGRNVGATAMDPERWDAAIADCMNTLARFGSVESHVVGPSNSPDWGTEDAAWFALTLTDVHSMPQVQEALGALASRYEQDALVITTGNTGFIEAPA